MNRYKYQLFWFLIILAFACLPPQAIAQDKPNIVLVFLDNFGWGEPGFNGGGDYTRCSNSTIGQTGQ